MMRGFEHFWLNVRFRGQSINEEHAGLTLEQRRGIAAGAFEMWRLGKIDIDYERNELVRSP
jgi:hypothetical protein